MLKNVLLKGIFVALLPFCSLVIIMWVRKRYVNNNVNNLNVHMLGGIDMGNEVYSASTIAKWFLYYNDRIMEEEDTDLISNLKLQKLLYYAQGCYLALNDMPLFNNKIVNWEHGPVVEEVYREYRNNGARGIEYINDYNGEIDEKTESLLREVYDVFGKYSAWGLRNMTHEETPWKSTCRNQIIPNELIKKYFEENYITD